MSLFRRSKARRADELRRRAKLEQRRAAVDRIDAAVQERSQERDRDFEGDIRRRFE